MNHRLDIMSMKTGKRTIFILEGNPRLQTDFTIKYKVVILWDIFKDRQHGWLFCGTQHGHFNVLTKFCLICICKCSLVLMLANVNKIQSVSGIGTCFWGLMLANINPLQSVICLGNCLWRPITANVSQIQSVIFTYVWQLMLANIS